MHGTLNPPDVVCPLVEPPDEQARRLRDLARRRELRLLRDAPGIANPDLAPPDAYMLIDGDGRVCLGQRVVAFTASLASQERRDGQHSRSSTYRKSTISSAASKLSATSCRRSRRNCGR